VSVRHRFRSFRALAAAILLLGLVVAPGSAADGSASDPFPEPVPGQTIYDTAGVLSPSTIRMTTTLVDTLSGSWGATLVIYTQVADDPSPGGTAARADALLAQWLRVWPELEGGIVLLAEVDRAGDTEELAFATDGLLDEATLESILEERTRPMLEFSGIDSAVMVATSWIMSELADPVMSPSRPGVVPVAPGEPGAPPDAPPPGPPFPEPELDRAVYDLAGVFQPDTVAAVEATIDRIEARTGAEIVVYTQVVDWGVSTAQTETRARALIDQWGVGRAGFDDGLAIFFDFEPNRDSGQVQLYAAPGFENTFLTNSERQRIFEEDMLPFLRIDDFDRALLVAMEKIDEAATPENAARLQLARQADAVLGLVGAPIVFMGIVGAAVFAWRRYGKDPVYLDSPSILMPAPPPDLTAASGAMVVDGETSRRALTTAMLDLASRGLISFREESGTLGIGRKVGIDIDPPRGDAVTEAHRARNARRPIGPAEKHAYSALKRMAGSSDGYISPSELPNFGSKVAEFDRSLETHVVREGWFREKPSAAVGRWQGRGCLSFFGGIILIVVAASIPITGLILIGAALIAAGILVALIAQAMPAVTMPGAMIRAMLAAYRRTLKKTMEQARSMDEVVERAGLDWLDTPDQAVVWGTALGLQAEIEAVLKRSLDDLKSGDAVAGSTYLPSWYGRSGGGSFATTGGSGGAGSIFSSSAIPNFGGMMSVLGTIGNSPSSSGNSSGGGGGFSGGSSGGGGGGAGGGF
jgi:uncharacterized membrane protein YgcG